MVAGEGVTEAVFTLPTPPDITPCMPGAGFGVLGIGEGVVVTLIEPLKAVILPGRRGRTPLFTLDSLVVPLPIGIDSWTFVEVDGSLTRLPSNWGKAALLFAEWS